MDDGDAVLALRVVEVGNERAIDLDLIEREAAQIAERGVSRTEIIEREFDAERPQLVQQLMRLCVIAEQHALRDLELQAIGAEPRKAERVFDIFVEVALFKLYGGEVDGDLDVLGPRGGFLTGLLERPRAHLHDQAGLLGERE